MKEAQIEKKDEDKKSDQPDEDVYSSGLESDNEFDLLAE